MYNYWIYTTIVPPEIVFLIFVFRSYATTYLM